MRTTLAAGFGLLALFAAAPLDAATIHVNCAHANLQNKINNAAPGSTLEIESTCKGQFSIGKSLKLVGDPKGTLDGNGGGPTLTLTGGSVELAHLIVTGGRISGGVQAFGAGINATNTHLTLRRVVVRGNVAHATGDSGQAVIAIGGGILSTQGSLKLVSSVVRGNTASAQAGFAQAFGGGIELGGTGSVTVRGSTVEDNKAIATSLGTSALSQGGGVFVDEGELSVKLSTFDGNLAKATGPAGPTTADGGCIYLSDAESLLAARSKLSGNRAVSTTGGTSAVADGGCFAGFVTHGTLSKSKLASNVARAGSTQDASSAGGGASVRTANGLLLLSTKVTSNQTVAVGPGGTGASGGGLDNPAGKLELRQSTVNGNSSQAPSTGSASGGGIGSAGDLVLKASTISRNSADAGGTIGGGIVLAGTGTGSITNSTIAKNRALGSTARGGGIDTFRNLTLTSSTVAFNVAKIGGGIYVEQPTTTLRATIVAGNSAPDSPQCSGPLESGGWNLISSTTQCVINPKGSDRLDKPARLGKLGSHGGPTQTIPIRSTSPAKNAIPAASCPVARDQRGVKRPQGPRCDIGSFERKP